ncbi:hypothetical protein RVR_5157 [Actinacidiphila reveromycinica]|uniref:Uncharacterized protein n=1 Tax=Actinacidiphila reveromycinica TaxID=659352 RepID=A0A7U3VPM1_9ACTN|nr:hypothetical protein [Streptomyces sp. SN-593]BBA98814.1 hypothetical protein RVR_5157 [Streptomyces sp. SN-593]
MDPEITTLTQQAGTTLVALMATDAWQGVRGAVLRMWQTLQPDHAAAVGAELTTDQQEAAAAGLLASPDGDRVLTELRAQWQATFRRLVVARPEAAAELRGFLAEFASPVPAGTATPVTSQHATASGSGRVYQAGRDQHITER